MDFFYENEAHENGFAVVCGTDEAGNPTDNGLALLRFNNGELVWYVEDEEGNVIFYCFLPEAMLEE